MLTEFEWPVFDHRDGNGLNNRRDNSIRFETNAENIVHGGDRRRGMPKDDWELEKRLDKMSDTPCKSERNCHKLQNFGRL